MSTFWVTQYFDVLLMIYYISSKLAPSDHNRVWSSLIYFPLLIDMNFPKGVQLQAPAKRTGNVWQTFKILLVKHNVGRFGHYTNMCLTNSSCLWHPKNVFEKFQKHWQAKCACQAMLVGVAKRASMLNKQNSKCLTNNVCPFDLDIKSAKRTDIIWQTFKILHVKQNVCRLGHHTNTFLINVFCLWQANSACKGMFVMVANGTSMHDKQNFKCLPNNVCQFDRGLGRRWETDFIDDDL